MPNERNYYVLCDDNCRFPAMTKEEIIAAIAEATGATPTHIDDAFITKIKEQNENTAVKFWVGTSAEYNALETKYSDVLYMITDDDTVESIYSDLDNMQAEIDLKQDAISDLDEIREGASLGETAMQNPSGGSEGDVLTKTEDGMEWKSAVRSLFPPYVAFSYSAAANSMVVYFGKNVNDNNVNVNVKAYKMNLSSSQKTEIQQYHSFDESSAPDYIQVEAEAEGYNPAVTVVPVKNALVFQE